MAWVKISGIYNAFFGFLHLWFLYSWRHSAGGEQGWARLPAGVANLLDIFNIQIAILFLIVGGLYLLYSGAIVTTPFGLALTVGMLVFWIARTLEEIAATTPEYSYLAVFTAGVVVHGMVLRQTHSVRREKGVQNVA